eukprot:gene34197-44181_t
MVSSDQKSLTELGESLIKSTFDGNYVCMRELFDEGVTLDYKSKDGDTPLIIATIKNRVEAVSLLLNMGAQESLTDKWGRTSLIIAALNNFQEIAKLLLKAGASVNAQDKVGNTALISATRYNHRDMVTLLLTAGAATHIQDNWGNTALTFAASQNFSEVLAILVSKTTSGGLSSVNKDGDTPLHLAIRQDSANTATDLVRFGADSKGMTAELYTQYLQIKNLLNGVERSNIRDRRVNAMRARDKRLALALHHEEHTIVYVAPGQTDGSLGGNGGTAGIPSPYPNKDDALVRVDAFLRRLEEHRDTHLLDSIDQYFANLTHADDISLRKNKLWSLEPASDLLPPQQLNNNELYNPGISMNNREEVKGIMTKPSVDDKKTAKKSKKLTIKES